MTKMHFLTEIISGSHHRTVLLIVAGITLLVCSGVADAWEIESELQTHDNEVTTRTSPATTAITTIETTPINVTGQATTPSDKNDLSKTSIGFIAAAVAVLFFGSNIVPVKNTDTGDGMFYQWIMCSAIWQVGLVVQLVRGSPQFHPSAMLGGLLWASGNCTVIPIIKTIGLGLGILLWGSVMLICGWASGHFGLFGLTPDKIDDQALNYIGFGLALVSVFLFLFVKSDVTEFPSQEHERRHFIPTNVNHYEPIRSHINNDSSWVDKLSPIQKRITGCCLSVIAGCLYGFNFVPCIWIQDNVEGASKNGLDYVFSHFCGIYLSSTCYFALYCVYMRNRPRLFQCLVLPSIASGVMWGIAQTAWFVANANLTESVSFPIITTVPGIIGALWGVFYFREIRGWKNYSVLLVACSVTAASAVLTVFSKTTDGT